MFLVTSYRGEAVVAEKIWIQHAYVFPWKRRKRSLGESVSFHCTLYWAHLYSEMGRSWYIFDWITAASGCIRGVPEFLLIFHCNTICQTSQCTTFSEHFYVTHDRNIRGVSVIWEKMCKEWERHWRTSEIYHRVERHILSFNHECHLGFEISYSSGK